MTWQKYFPAVLPIASIYCNRAFISVLTNGLLLKVPAPAPVPSFLLPSTHSTTHPLTHPYLPRLIPPSIAPLTPLYPPPPSELLRHVFVNEFHNEEDEPNYPGGAITLPIDDNTKLNAQQVDTLAHTSLHYTLHDRLLTYRDDNTMLNAPGDHIHCQGLHYSFIVVVQRSSRDTPCFWFPVFFSLPTSSKSPLTTPLPSFQIIFISNDLWLF